MNARSRGAVASRRAAGRLGDARAVGSPIGACDIALRFTGGARTDCPVGTRPRIASTRTVRRMRWTVHGERSLYESEWVRLVLVDVEIPGGERFEHHVVRMPNQAAGTVVRDPDRGRAAAVASPLHHRHVGMGDPGRTHRSRRDAARRPRRARRSRKPAGSRRRCDRSCATSRRTGCRIRCSTSSSPTARRTSASRPIAGESERVEWVARRRAARARAGRGRCSTACR